MHLYYYLDDMYVAYIDFQVNEDIEEIYIEMIEVGDDFRRRGIATKMFNKLRNEYPDYYIDWGYTLPDGEKLKQALTDTIENPEYIELKSKIDKMDEELEELERYANDDDWLEQSTQEEREAIGDKWDQLYDEKRDLENELQDIRRWITTWK